MDPIASLKSDVFRPLVTTLIPGVLAASPYALIAVHRFSDLKAMLSAPVVAGIAFFVIGLLVGMLLEDLGSRIEIFIWNMWLKTPSRNHEWSMYLRLKTKDEFVGQRYLESVHVRLEFELTMIPGLILFLLGIVWCNIRCGSVTNCHMTLICLAGLAAIGYLFYEACESSVTLCEARSEIIAGYRADQELAK